MYHRLFAASLLLISIGLGIVAWGYHAPFSYEPVGPRAYPLLLLILLGAGSLLLVFKPAMETGSSEDAPLTQPMLIRAGICLGLFLALAFFYESAGFIISSLVFALAMARLFGGQWLHSVILSLVLSIGLYFLFDRVLDVPLPLGLLSGLEI